MEQHDTESLLVGAIKDRGRLYLTAFRELAKRYGQAEAESVMSAVSREIGIVAGKSLACHAPCDFTRILDEFFKTPDDGRTYATTVARMDATCLEIRQMACPLRDSWIEAGCSDEEVCTLLKCASAFDITALETAGFDCMLETWSPGKQGCCHAIVTRKATPRDGEPASG